jgi:threonine/homoserine/homoserine lactone efflux protein
MITLDFLITSFIVVLILGTGAVFTVSTGLMRGKRASLWAALGCTLSIVPHLLATILGLVAIMHTSALAFSLLKYAGVAYLLYLAYATWQDRSGFSFDQAPSEASAWQLVVKAILLNLLNPKLTIFFLAFRSFVMGSKRVQDWMRRSFAGAFAGLGLNLALTEQR